MVDIAVLAPAPALHGTKCFLDTDSGCCTPSGAVTYRVANDALVRWRAAVRARVQLHITGSTHRTEADPLNASDSTRRHMARAGSPEGAAALFVPGVLRYAQSYDGLQTTPRAGAVRVLVHRPSVPHSAEAIVSQPNDVAACSLPGGERSNLFGELANVQAITSRDAGAGELIPTQADLSSQFALLDTRGPDFVILLEKVSSSTAAGAAIPP
ncbi:hypothetical protein HYPSUDRAFT_201401 [Hypholoma sublateritium FD-334 SS-4]|uniref:Uncharacterized protein n=1 Tax=Hypholoma sublateritium (strain FD-334 SS-4) TaxID=945553 RepID=A0A0D2L841_HYPSF|nr:hypothetical protein HYPSUDRAFT_201401 [Hypholoma sublateritium FD-334 SS-4]